MSPKDITLFVAADRHHVGELAWSYRTWAKFKPEVLSMPFLLMYDKLEFDGDDDPAFNQFRGHTAGFRAAAWSMPSAADQREKMLTALVAGPALHVRTPWYLKLDTDTFAKEPGPWIIPHWFGPSSRRKKLPVFVTNPWGYTKPARSIATLEEWGDGVRPIADFPRLGLTAEPGARRLYHPRIISWLFFGNTEWTRQMYQTAHYGGGRLPVPSQDTFLFYCAARTQEHYMRVRMSDYGWGHVGRKTDRLIETCKRLLADD